jgi:hypothetical protein
MRFRLEDATREYVSPLLVESAIQTRQAVDADWVDAECHPD